MFSPVDDVGMSCSPQQKVGGSALPTLRRQARLSLADLRSAEKETVLVPHSQLQDTARG